MNELRSHKRYKTTEEILANIEKFQIDVIEINPLLISLVDISEGGMCIHIENPIGIDNHVEIKMEIETEIFTLISRVVWVENHKEHYKAGLEIVFVEEEFIYAIKEMIDDSERSGYFA